MELWTESGKRRRQRQELIKLDTDCVPISTMIPVLRREGILKSPRHCSTAENVQKKSSCH